MRKIKDIAQQHGSHTPQSLRDSSPILGEQLLRPIGLIGLIGLMSFMLACSDDSSERRGEWQLLELVPYYNIYKVGEEESTRARDTELFGATDGAGPYVPYEIISPQADERHSKIHIFMTRGNDIESEGDFAFHATDYYTAEEAAAYNTANSLSSGDPGYKTAGDIKSAARWTSGVWIKNANEDYYVYGYMSPTAVDEAILSPNSNFENKAILNLNGLNAVTPADLCVVVGVKGLSKADQTVDGDNITVTPIAESGIEIGNFKYTSHAKLTDESETDDSKKGNYIYLLLDHLYTCLNLKYQVGSKYSELRSIRLRKVEIGVEGNEAYNVQVTINGSEYDIDYTPIGSTRTRTATVFDRMNATEGLAIPTVTTLNVPGYFSPKVGGTFIVTTTYDVYDKQGNLIREKQTAVNNIQPEYFGIIGTAHEHERGKVHTLRLIIEPTYLYQLSDTDLDNPTIKVNSGS